jgi:hypothetical protein
MSGTPTDGMWRELALCKSLGRAGYSPDFFTVSGTSGSGNRGSSSLVQKYWRSK